MQNKKTIKEFLTNWDEIAKEKTDVKPPDGMEYKKWDS